MLDQLVQPVETGAVFDFHGLEAELLFEHFRTDLTHGRARAIAALVTLLSQIINQLRDGLDGTVACDKQDERKRRQQRNRGQILVGIISQLLEQEAGWRNDRARRRNKHRITVRLRTGDILGRDVASGPNSVFNHDGLAGQVLQLATVVANDDVCAGSGWEHADGMDFSVGVFVNLAPARPRQGQDNRQSKRRLQDLSARADHHFLPKYFALIEQQMVNIEPVHGLPPSKTGRSRYLAQAQPGGQRLLRVRQPPSDLAFYLNMRPWLPKPLDRTSASIGGAGFRCLLASIQLGCD